MQTVALILGVIFTTFSFFVTADEHENYYDAYPVPAYTSGVSTADEKQGIDETAMLAALPGIASLLGIVVLAWAQANDHNNQQNTIDDQKTKVSNICTSLLNSPASQLALTTCCATTGGTALDSTSLATVAATAQARLNIIEAALNAMQTQNAATSCS